VQPEVYSCLTQAHRHENTNPGGWWTGYKHRRLKEKHKRKAQKLRTRAIKLSGDKMITQQLIAVGLDQVMPNLRHFPNVGAIEADKRHIREYGQKRPLKVRLHTPGFVPIYQVTNEASNVLYHALKELRYGQVNILIED
jgi:hypothetical protein